MESVKRFISSVLCLTRQCNLACTYCLVPTIRTLDASESDLLDALDVIDEYAEFVVILGGEPTISPHLDAVIAKLRYLGTKFTLVSNGITLKDKVFRHHLRDIGLESVTVSYDSYKSFSTEVLPELVLDFSDVSVNIIYDRRMVGNLLPLIERLTCEGVWSIVTAYIHFDDDREHWYFSKPVDGFVIPPEMRSDVQHEMDEIVEHYDRLKVHNSKDYFVGMPAHAFDMAWHCNEWNVLFVNNDLRVQFCQDLPASGYVVSDLDTKMDEMSGAWRRGVGECSGCYVNCYFDAEHLPVERIQHIE
jgi:hypothetical protein